MMQTQPANSIDKEAVARKAYELWVQGGRREGVAEENWIQAEQIVRGNQAPRTEVESAPKSDPPSSPRSSSSLPAASSNNKKPMKRH
jgi:hypothetical protein